jgi:hypothetical protein
MLERYNFISYHSTIFMKKIFLFTLLQISLLAGAQEKLGIGIKVGQNFTSVN